MSQLLMRCALLTQPTVPGVGFGVRGVCALYLNGLGYVHLVNFYLREATSRHIFILFLIAVKEVSGIDANADGTLGQRNKQSAPGEAPVG